MTAVLAAISLHREGAANQKEEPTEQDDIENTRFRSEEDIGSGVTAEAFRASETFRPCGFLWLFFEWFLLRSWWFVWVHSN